MRELTCKLNLKLVEHGATHHVGDSYTWIDVILTDEDNVVLNAGNSLVTLPNKQNIIDVEINFKTVDSPPLLKKSRDNHAIIT